MGFEVLFEAGRRFAEGVVEPRAAGNVQLPTGRIVVGDPTTAGHAALVRRVPPGRYPATISVARVGNHDQRVAAAMLRFRAGAVSSWEPALPEGRTADAPSPDEYFGFGIGSGLACFADASVPFPHDVGDTTISVFSANEGTYVSFWGLDATGQPIVLVTDFRVVGSAETRAAELLVEHWPGSSLDDEITRNWEPIDIVAPLPEIAMPAAGAGAGTAAAAGAAPKRKAKASTKAGVKAIAAAKPVAKPAAKPATKPRAKAAAKSAAKPAAKSAAKPAAKAAAKLGAKSAAKSAAKLGAKSAAKLGAKPKSVALNPSPKPAARKQSPKPAARKPSPKPAARKPSPKPAARKPKR